MEENYVSRAGEKLAFALKEFHLSVEGFVCADLGCSTGGFVDVLLQHGASKVYAVDTGYGVLDWKLRNDPRVVVMERTNALHVQIPEPLDFVSIDAGWTRQKLILPHALSLLKPGGYCISLLKPHYEAPKEYLYKGGILPEEYQEEVIHGVEETLAQLPLTYKGRVLSPVLGKKGDNKEYLLFLQEGKA